MSCFFFLKKHIETSDTRGVFPLEVPTGRRRGRLAISLFHRSRWERATRQSVAELEAAVIEWERRQEFGRGEIESLKHWSPDLRGRSVLWATSVQSRKVPFE